MKTTPANNESPSFTALVVEDNDDHRKTLCAVLQGANTIKWNIVCYDGSFETDDVRWWVEDQVVHGSVWPTICFLDLVWIPPGDSNPRQTALSKQNEFLRVLLTPHTKRFADGPSGVDGLVVLPALRRIPFLQVVVHSTFGSNGLRTFAAEMGAMATLQKLPFGTPGTRTAVADYEQSVGRLVSKLSTEWSEKCDTHDFGNWLHDQRDTPDLARLRRTLNLEKDEVGDGAKRLSAEALRLQIADLEKGLVQATCGKKTLTPQLPPKVQRLQKDILSIQTFSRRVNELAVKLKVAEDSNKTLVIVGGCPMERKSLFAFAASKANIESWLVFECQIPEGVPKFTPQTIHENSGHWIVLRGLSDLHDSNRAEVVRWLHGVAHGHGNRTRPWRVLVVIDHVSNTLSDFLRSAQGEWDEYVIPSLAERPNELVDYVSCLWACYTRRGVTVDIPEQLKSIPFPTLSRLDQTIRATFNNPKSKLVVPDDLVEKASKPTTGDEFTERIKRVGLTTANSFREIGAALGVSQTTVSNWANELGVRIGKVDSKPDKLTPKMPVKKGK